MAWIERIDKRSKKAKHWQDNVNSALFRVDLTAHDQHYLDESAVWQNVDETVEVDGLNGFAYRVNKVKHWIRLNADGSRRWYPRRNYPSEYVTFGRLQYYSGTAWVNVPFSTPVREGNTVSWDQTNFALNLAVTWRKVKVEVTLKNSNAARRLRWSISLTGLTRSGYDLIGVDGTTVGSVEPPVAWDATVIVHRDRPNIIITPSVSGGYVYFDGDLSSAVFPVIIDPTLTTPQDSTVADTSPYSENPTETWGGYEQMAIGGKSGYLAKGLIEWDLSSIGSGVTYNSITASFWTYSADYFDTTLAVTARRVLDANSSWTEGGACWNYRVGTTAWAGAAGCSTSGTDYSSTSMGSTNVTSEEAANTRHDITLGATEFEAMRSSNNGLLLLTATGDSYWKPHSSDGATSGYRPLLVVVYEEGGTSTPMTLEGAITPTGVLTSVVNKLVAVIVNASADDADEVASTAVSITANPLANCDTSGVWNAWVFRGITIPAGATIVSSYIIINFTSTSLDEPDVRIYGLDTATPAAFQANNADISSRARTTAYTDWSNANAGGDDVNTSSLNGIIEELVASYAPYSSGVMGFCWTTRAGSSTRDTSETSYDGSTSLCARLRITYSYIPASGTSTPMTLAGASTPTGVLTRVINAARTYTGGTTPTGVLGKVLTLVRTLAGASTPTGTVTKQSPRTFAGASTPSGVLGKVMSIARTLAGAFTPGGTLDRAFGKPLDGAIASAGTLERSFTRTLAGACALAGTVVKSIPRAYAGASALSGTLVKQIEKLTAGGITPSGVLTRILTLTQTLAGVLGSTGTIVKSTIRTMTGDVTLAGDLVKYKAKVLTLAGEIIPTGVLTRVLTLNQTLAGAVSFVGAVVKSISGSFAGGITPSGVLSGYKAIVRAFDGAVSLTGTLGKLIASSLYGTISVAGTLTKSIAGTLDGTLTSSGILTSYRAILKTFDGVITPAGDLIKQLLRTFAGTVNSVGTYVGGLLVTITRFVQLTLSSRSKALTILARTDDLTIEARTNDLTLNSRSNDLTLNSRSDDLTLEERGHDS